MSLHVRPESHADSGAPFPGVLPAGRLTLRPLHLEDAPRIHRFTTDPTLARMVSSVPLPQPEVSVEGWILIVQARAPMQADHVFAMHLPDEGLIGIAAAHRRRMPDGVSGAEIGFWVGAPFQRRGFATEAARAIAKHARALTVGPVAAGHFEDNPASGTVLARAGFVYTGETIPTFSIARKARAPMRRMELPRRS